MVLLAILLIGAGLACLAFVAYSFARTRPAHYAASTPAAPAPAPAPAAPAPAPAPAAAFQPAAPPAAAPRPRVPQSEPPAEPESPVTGAAAENEPKHRPELEQLRERLSGLKRVDPDALNETLRVYERTERAPEPAPQLVVAGTLYLDHGRRLPGQLGRHDQEIPARLFSELRRVGNGTLILERSNFVIHSGNASYSYSAGDMDQILFQSGGLALVPIHADRAIPVFLTRQVEQVKAYIKKNARIRSL